MDAPLFIQAKAFIYADIQREIDLAAVTKDRKGASFLKSLGIHPGGGNFLAALGLLCYTEFAGGLARNKLKVGESRRNFNHFFDLLGADYARLRKTRDVYKDLRCGLVHEYFAKKTCDIGVFTARGKKDIGVEYNAVERKYIIRVRRYFEDFKRAFDALEKRLFP